MAKASQFTRAISCCYPFLLTFRALIGQDRVVRHYAAWNRGRRASCKGRSQWQRGQCVCVCVCVCERERERKREREETQTDNSVVACKGQLRRVPKVYLHLHSVIKPPMGFAGWPFLSFVRRRRAIARNPK